jgi:hypothetical protein
MNTSSPSTLDHLDRMSDHRGLFEHAEGAVRREEHGYCTDDNARMLIVMSREPDVGPAHRLSRLALHFVRGAQAADGRCHNRMNRFGRWTDGLTTDDCWGRSLYALGTAATQHPNLAIRTSARLGFDRGVRQRSPWARAMAFAALGATEVAVRDPAHGPARALLVDALDTIGPISAGTWPWPEARLTYANATLAEAVIGAGAALDDSSALERGLTMLAWLLDLETPRGHLSVTGIGGRGPGDVGPQFDQQPIEAAAMADACWRAYTVTGDHTWMRGVVAAASWFAGDNDTGVVVHDEVSAGGYDGLQAVGVNLNQGAESTLAFISTMQRVRSFAPSP